MIGLIEGMATNPPGPDDPPHLIRTHYVQYIPGPLQSPLYARGLIEAAGRLVTWTVSERLAARDRQRAAILSGAVKVEAVIPYKVLRDLTGPMASEQLRYLIDLINRGIAEIVVPKGFYVNSEASYLIARQGNRPRMVISQLDVRRATNRSVWVRNPRQVRRYFGEVFTESWACGDPADTPGMLWELLRGD